MSIHATAFLILAGKADLWKDIGEENGNSFVEQPRLPRSRHGCIKLNWEISDLFIVRPRIQQSG
jgi:hypothetical protein